MQLGHVVRADGRWRIFIFAPAQNAAAAIKPLCDFLEGAANSPVKKYTPAGSDIDAVIDVRAIFQQGHPDVAIEKLPSLLLPGKGRLSLQDYEKVFSADLKSGHGIFAMRGIDRARGCMVVVRPDQFVAQVLPLDGHAQLTAYFDAFMLSA
jgi:phenol 2-monooxygenase